MSSEPTLLIAMKAEAEKLWQAVIHAETEEEKQTYRKKYQEAFNAYKRQCIITDENSTPTRMTGSAPLKANKAGSYPDPFGYHDYREFLLAWLKFAENSPGSLRAFAENSGITALQLARALKRWQPLSRIDFRKILRSLSLSETEDQFLEALHCISDTESQEVRFAAMKRLQSFARFKTKQPAQYEAWRYLSHWYYVAIREMSRLAGFCCDPVWIQSRLRMIVPLNEIKKALKFLEGAGFFRANKNGMVDPLIKEVACEGGVYRIALAQFHREMLNLASDSITRVSSDKRVFLGQTVALSKSSYEKARAILEDCNLKISEIPSAENSTDDVYHIELAAFPLSRGSEYAP